MGVTPPATTDNLSSADEGEGTGLPLFRTWRAVYAVVLGAFVLYVILLTWFAMHFTQVKP
jgi:hypothetical protein